MITQAIIDIFLTIFTGLFSVFPSFPPMPEIINTGWDWFITSSAAGTGLIAYLLSTPLYYATIALIIFMTTFEYIYQFLIRFLIFRIFMGLIGR